MSRLRFLQIVYLVAFALACRFAGLSGWRYAAIVGMVAIVTIVFALAYENMIRAQFRRLEGKYHLLRSGLQRS